MKKSFKNSKNRSKTVKNRSKSTEALKNASKTLKNSPKTPKTAFFAKTRSSTRIFQKLENSPYDLRSFFSKKPVF